MGDVIDHLRIPSSLAWIREPECVERIVSMIIDSIEESMT